MKKYNTELAVGIFVLIGLLCVGYLTIRLGKLEFFSKSGYTLYAKFQSVSGLRNGANIELAGVPIGKVSSVKINPTNHTQAMVAMQITPEIILSIDTIAAVRTSGLIGDKYISLAPGKAETMFKDGDVFMETDSVVDIEALLSKFVFGGSKMEGLSERGYDLHALFSSAAGLDVGANVEISGVPVGKVTSIVLDEKMQSGAKVTLRLAPWIRLSDDAIASIKSSSLIGGKYVNISQGGSGSFLAEGEEITETEPAVDLESLISKYVFGGVK